MDMEKNKKVKKEWNKAGQITVFIILAVMIVVVLILLFRDKAGISFIITKPESPADKISKCVKDVAGEGLVLIKNQGGYLAPENSYLYLGNKVGYLCYAEEYYMQCVMQKPMLKTDIEKELKTYLDPKIKDCIDSVKGSLENQNYAVDYKNPETSIKLAPSSIIIDINLDLKISKDTTTSYKNIKVDISSKLYEFAMTAMSIANWEARYGDSETMSYMFYYPTLKVEKKARDEGTRIYILTDRESGENFMFAVRSYAIPSGVTGR
ncbi:MAG: hypothetical protein AABX54_03425 [Nanoarchaeota archaeon]